MEFIDTKRQKKITKKCSNMNQSRCQNDYLFYYLRVPSCFVKIQE